MKSLQSKNYVKLSLLLLVFSLCSISLSANTFSTRPQIGVDTAGNVIAVWEGTDPVTFNSVIQASYLPFGGSWVTPVTLSPSTDSSSRPALSVNSAGDSVAVWLVNDLSGGTSLHGSIKPVSLPWGSPQLISSTDTVLSNYVVSLSDSGNIVASWDAYIDITFTSVIRAATTTVVGGTWSIANTLSP